MAIERSKRRLGASRLQRTARSLLDASPLCAIATVSPSGRAHVNTAYFAWNAELELFWSSDSRARHSENIAANGSAAIAVYDSRQRWGGGDCGIQLFGTARGLTGAAAAEAESVYARHFAEF